MYVHIKYIKDVEDIDNIEEATQFSYCMAKKYLYNIPHSKRIIIKPNIVAPMKPSTGATTHHEVIRGVLNALKGREVKIVESDATSSDFNENVAGWGYSFLMKDYPNVDLINLSKEEKKKEKIYGLNGKEYEIEIPDIISGKNTFLINLQVIKTHILTGVSLGIKNLFGLIPEKNKSKYHVDIHDILFALFKRFEPSFTILDGIVGMQKQGPIFGEPANSKILFASYDTVSVDTIAARLMGFDPYKIKYLKNAIDYRSIYKIKAPPGSVQESEDEDYTTVQIEFNNTP